jgi:hypothetical protein
MSEEPLKNENEAAFSQLGVGKLRSGTLQVTLAEEVLIEDLHKLIDRIVILNGCFKCGLAGIDIYMRGVDPIMFNRFADIGAVRNVTLIR